MTRKNPIDYSAAQRIYVQQKAALTRAIKSGDREKILAAARRAVRQWGDAPFNGAWPDDWSRWQRAVDDAFWSSGRRLRLEDLDSGRANPARGRRRSRAGDINWSRV